MELIGERKPTSNFYAERTAMYNALTKVLKVAKSRGINIDVNALRMEITTKFATSDKAITQRLNALSTVLGYSIDNGELIWISSEKV